MLRMIQHKLFQRFDHAVVHLFYSKILPLINDHMLVREGTEEINVLQLFLHFLEINPIPAR